MASKFSAGLSKVVVALLLVGPAFLLIFISTRGCEHKFKELEDYGKEIPYQFTDARGKKYSYKDFNDDIVLVNTIQSTCPDKCSISFWHLDQHIYQHIRKNRKKLKQMRIISFVLDENGQPEKDLSTIVNSLKDNIVDYNPDIWIIAKGDPKTMYNFKHNGQQLIQEGKKYFAGNSYTELMLLLDKKNHLRMVGRGKQEGEIRRMKEHMALLQKQYDKERKKHQGK